MNTAPKTTVRTVLVVEDENSLRLVMSLVLKTSGYRVLQASSGQEALEIFKAENPDVIVSDVRMPNGDGIELLQKVRELSQRPVFVLVTGYTSLQPEEAFAMGADAMFAKPFDRVSLLNTISEKLQSPRSKR